MNPKTTNAAHNVQNNSSQPQGGGAKKNRKQMRRKEKKILKKAAKKVHRTGNAIQLQDGTRISLAGDVRTSKALGETMSANGELPAITIEVPISINQITGICLEYVSFALSRGYLATSPSPGYPYWAFVYMCNVLIAYVTGGTPQATALPLWLQEFGQAMQPKRVKFGNGLIYYKFLLFPTTSPFIPTANVPIGSQVYGYEWLAYDFGTGNVDGFPTSQPPPGYTNDLGEQAWASLAQFMQVEHLPRTRVVPLKVTYWARNVSAFALTTIPEGLGWNNSGGWTYTAGLEVPILTPILTTMCGNLAEGSVSSFRYGNRPVVAGGDAIFSSGWFSHISPDKFLSIKRPVRFHFVDFLEFQNVMAIYVQTLIQTCYNDPINGGNIPADRFVCPITLQEMGLLLRNELMCQFGATQTAVQSLYPRTPKSTTDDEFVPFICGSTTVGIQGSGMKLPLPLVENAKSLMCRMAMHAPGADPEAFVPVLGQYNNMVLNPKDYVATTADGTAVACFATLESSVSVRRRSSKGEGDWVPAVEAPISFIDGTSGSNYVFINDPTRLSTLTALWNEWLVNLSTYSDPLRTLSRDLGVNAVVSLGSTRHWVDVPVGEKERNSDFVDLRVKSRAHMKTPYAAREAIATSSHDRIISAAWDEVDKVWILPINYSSTGIGLDDNTPFQRVQIISEEPFRVANTAGETGQTFSSLHMIYAQLMTHGRDASDSKMSSFFLEMEQKSTGGILSGLVAGFLGKQFGSTVGSIANTVADLIPI